VHRFLHFIMRWQYVGHSGRLAEITAGSATKAVMANINLEGI
jgi:hypothetical protein